MGAVYLTDQGKVRLHNEDSGGVFENKHGEKIAVIADGMGGHRAGDIASSMTVEQLHTFWEDKAPFHSPAEAEQWFLDTIHKVNKQLLLYAENHEECKGMGTTFVGALCTSSFCTVAHVGDSRCYILNESGFSQLTEDHSLVNELVRNGQISKEDAEHHPRKNILLRALGTEKNIEIDVKTVEVEKGDFLLLCSDGLSNKLSDEQLKEVLTSETSIEAKAKSLVDVANELGGEDNITLIIVEFEHESE